MFSQEVWLLPILYMVSFITIITIGKSLKQGGALVNALFAMLAFGLSLMVLIERLQPHTLDYSFHLDWLNIGEVYYTVGYELTNLTSWLLTLGSGVYFLINMMMLQKKDQLVGSSIYAYMSLLMFALSGVLLSDSVLSFYICSILLSTSVYLILTHTSFESNKQLISRYILSQLMAHTALLVVIVVLYWYMPDTSLQFTMLQNVFGGQAEPFTMAMRFWLSLSVLASVIFFTGTFPYFNWLKLVRHQPPMLQLLISTVGCIIVPVYTLIAFYELIASSPIVVTLGAWLGLLLVLWCTIRLFVQRNNRGSYYVQLNIGLWLFGQRVEMNIQLLPVLICIIFISVGVALGWLYSRRMSESVEKRFLMLEESIRKFFSNISDRIIRYCAYVLQWLVLLERRLHQLFTVWLPYPLRRISHMSAHTTVARSTTWMIIIVSIITVLYTLIGRG